VTGATDATPRPNAGGGPPALRLVRLSLTDFRSYGTSLWQPTGQLVVITGPNGSGKTNLLEAVSLLVPGRGLRAARNADLARRASEGRWAVAGRFETQAGQLDIGTGLPPGSPMRDERLGAQTERRVFRMDGAPPRNQAAIAARLAAVWLTPQMDRLFQEGAGARRRFLDRLVWALEPGHAREVAAHDAAMTSRNRLLAADRPPDSAWLAGLEDAMARHAVAATAARIALVDALNGELARGVAGTFPAVHMRLLCPIAERLAQAPALAVEDWLRLTLAGRRQADAAAGTACIGAHRADMALEEAGSGLPASLASTGQQKTMLIGVVLGHAAVIARSRGFAPLLLLDEPMVHLDEVRRGVLFEALLKLPAQVLITGTDAELFAPWRGLVEGFLTGEGSVRPDPALPWQNPASKAAALPPIPPVPDAL